jgi:hypothetical protein
MKVNDEIIYTIKINNTATDTTTQRELADIGIPISGQQISGNSIIVGRLFTKYRGPTQEEAFQQEVKAASGSEHVEFNLKPWSHLPGYPMGEMGEVTYEDE